MRNALVIMIGSVIAIMLGVVAIWSWVDAAAWASTSSKPDVLKWAARCLGVAAGAGAQIILFNLVIGRIYPHRPFYDTAKMLAGVVCSIAAVGAAALGMAARG